MARQPKHPVEGVLFDWDGTLINSYHADTSAYLAMFKEMGIRWGVKELEKHYSPNWYHVYRAAGLPRNCWDDADRLWRSHYAKHQPKLISGARRVLTQIGDAHHLGLVTSGDRDRVTWAEVGKVPLCLLTTDMQNRRIIDRILRAAGVEPASLP